MRPVWEPSRPTPGLKPIGGVLPAAHGARMHRDAGSSMRLLTGPVSVRSSSRHDRGATVGWAVPTDRTSGRRLAVAGPLIDAVHWLFLSAVPAPAGVPGAVNRRSPHHGCGSPPARRGGPVAHPILLYSRTTVVWCDLGWVAMPFCGGTPEQPGIHKVGSVRLANLTSQTSQ